MQPKQKNAQKVLEYSYITVKERNKETLSSWHIMKWGWSLWEFCDRKLLTTMTGRKQECLKCWVTSNNTNTLGWVVSSHIWTFSSSCVTRENNPCPFIYVSSKVARVDIKGYKGSSSYTKGVWKTLSSEWQSSSIYLNVNAIFFLTLNQDLLQYANSCRMWIDKLQPLFFWAINLSF